MTGGGRAPYRYPRKYAAPGRQIAIRTHHQISAVLSGIGRPGFPSGRARCILTACLMRQVSVTIALRSRARGSLHPLRPGAAGVGRGIEEDVVDVEPFPDQPAIWRIADGGLEVVAVGIPEAVLPRVLAAEEGDLLVAVGVVPGERDDP